MNALQKILRKITPSGRSQEKFERKIALWDAERDYKARKARAESECAENENILKWRMEKIEERYMTDLSQIGTKR